MQKTSNHSFYEGVLCHVPYSFQFKILRITYFFGYPANTYAYELEF